MTGFGLLAGSEIARVLAVLLLAFNAVLQVVWFPAPKGELVTVFADFSLGDALITVLEIFLLVAWIWVLITIFADLFNDHSVSEWGKAGWCVILLLIPFLGAFIYLIARGGKMQERALNRQVEAKHRLDSYVRETAASSSPADEISKLARLRSEGAISEAEFEQAKAKVIVSAAGDGAGVA